MSDAREPTAEPGPGQRIRADLVAAAVTVAVVAVFWTQRDYRERLSGLFPDFVLVGLAALAVFLAVRPVVSYAAARSVRSGRGGGDLAAGGDADEAAGARGVPVGRVVASMAFLAAWIVLLTPLGFTLSGILGFLALTIFVRRGSFRLKHLLVDIPVAVAVVWLCFLVFTRVLLVPLPVPPFLYG